MTEYFKDKSFLIFEKDTNRKLNLYKYFLNTDNIKSFSTQEKIFEELSGNHYDILIIESGRLDKNILNFLAEIKDSFRSLFIVVLSITNQMNIDRYDMKNIDLYLERPMIPKDVIYELSQYFKEKEK